MPAAHTWFPLRRPRLKPLTGMGKRLPAPLQRLTPCSDESDPLHTRCCKMTSRVAVLTFCAVLTEELCRVMYGDKAIEKCHLAS